MLPIDAVETGMKFGIALVWLCSGHKCGHEIERSVQYQWEHTMLEYIWRERFVRLLWEHGVGELHPDHFPDDEWREFYPSDS